MSSLQDKDRSVRRTVLLRKMSLEKIRCSAYPLLGSIFAKDSSFMRRLLENTMNSSRQLAQKPAICVAIPSIHILYVAMVLVSFVIRKLNGGVTVEKLDKLIAAVNQLKSKYQTYCIQHVIKQQVAREVERQRSVRGELICGETFYDCFPVSLKSPPAKPADKRLVLRVVSFACIFLVYTQFICLAYLITIAQLRAGFIFLIVCSFTLTYLVLQISFAKTSRDTTKKAAKALNSKTDFTELRSRENCEPEKEKLL